MPCFLLYYTCRQNTCNTCVAQLLVYVPKFVLMFMYSSVPCGVNFNLRCNLSRYEIDLIMPFVIQWHLLRGIWVAFLEGLTGTLIGGQFCSPS